MNARYFLFQRVQMLDQTLAIIRGAKKVYKEEKELLHPDDKKGNQRIDGLLKSLDIRHAIWDKEIETLIALSKNPSA